MATVFIDGQAGTTGLEISQRLEAHAGVDVSYLEGDARKDPDARRAAMAAADVAILCLPDDAAREAVALADGNCRFIDASTAHRVDPDWAYGLPEMDPHARERIAGADRVTNPGCYPQGFILLMRPLIEAGWLTASAPLRINAVSGYSGGGRQMIERFRAYSPEDAEALNTQLYGLGLNHKHVPEMQYYTGCERPPLFAPHVAHYYKGMLVEVPVFAHEMGGHTPAEVHALLAETYAGERFVRVLPLADPGTAPEGYLNPTACNGTNDLELMVFGNDEHVLLVARYDNLGKGAAGAAVQNLNLMLGLDEGTAL